MEIPPFNLTASPVFRIGRKYLSKIVSVTLKMLALQSEAERSKAQRLRLESHPLRHFLRSVPRTCGPSHSRWAAFTTSL